MVYVSLFVFIEGGRIDCVPLWCLGTHFLLFGTHFGVKIMSHNVYLFILLGFIVVLLCGLVLVIVGNVWVCAIFGVVLGCYVP